MDELRGKLLKIGGAVVALLVFFVGMKLGCGACEPDPAVVARKELLEIGCTRAGFTRGDPGYGDCIERAKASCLSDDESALTACAGNTRDGRSDGKDAGAADAVCLRLVDCAKLVGTKR